MWHSVWTKTRFILQHTPGNGTERQPYRCRFSEFSGFTMLTIYSFVNMSVTAAAVCSLVILDSHMHYITEVSQGLMSTFLPTLHCCSIHVMEACYQCYGIGGLETKTVFWLLKISIAFHNVNCLHCTELSDVQVVPQWNVLPFMEDVPRWWEWWELYSTWVIHFCWRMQNLSRGEKVSFSDNPGTMLRGKQQGEQQHPVDAGSGSQ